jgi:hypothetical protein
MILVDGNYRHDDWILAEVGAYQANISGIALISSEDGGDQRIQLRSQV